MSAPGEPRIVFFPGSTQSAREGTDSQVRKNAAGVDTAGTLLRFVVVNAVAGAGNETTVAHTFDSQLTAGDYIEVFAQQTSGGPLSVNGTIAGTFASIRWCAKTA